MSKVPFLKPALLLDDQLELLENRGLTIPDREAAKGYLKHVSYYRMSGYTRYFTDGSSPPGERFRAGITFTDVIDLYVFDRHLRILMAEAFERLEVSLKGQLAYQGATQFGPFWMTDPANFDAGQHLHIQKLVDEACAMPRDGKHKQQFMDAYYKKYADCYPPAWMLTEVLSFHGASKVYKHAKGAIRVPIAASFGVHQEVLASWLHALVFARNVCAHHGRFWNRRFTIEPKIPKNYRGLWPEDRRNKLYITCCIVHHMLTRISGEQHWSSRLRALINRRPPNLPLSQMGFPEDWERQSFWQF